MDLDDLDGPNRAPVKRPSRFAPKSSKPKLIPKPEPSSQPEPSKLDDVTLINKKEEDSQPPLVKKSDEPFVSSTQNGVIEMEVEAKAEVEDAMEEDDRDEDPVVREIDVFFTPPPTDDNTKIYVLQYPLRPYWRPYELGERCDEVRVKPASAEVEVDLSIDVDSKNYDPDAPNAQRMKKQTLSTSWKPPQTTGYVVGVLMGNKLHLNPIHAVVQLRPSMEYLSSGGAKRKNNVTGDANIAVKLEVSNEEESVGSLKKQNKIMGILDEQNTDAAESWVPLKYHSSDSDFSARYLQKMVAEDNSPIQFLMSPYEYVNSLCPPGVSNDDNRSKGLSRRFLLSMPLEERFKTLLCEKFSLQGPPVHRFSALKHFAPDNSVEDVLGVLTKHAHLVQGLWVPKSSLLFPGGQGVAPLARDYILLLFSKGPLINYSQVDVPGSLNKALKGFLSILAVERPSFRDWKFKEPTDVSFMKLHPDIVREQRRVWESLEKQITDIIHGGGRRGPVTKNSGKPSIANKTGTSTKSDGATRATNGTPVRRTAMSAETREALPKALEEVFRLHKVCSFQLICQALRDLAVSKSTSPKVDPRTFVAAAYGADAPQEELHAIISKYATNVHGVYVWKTSEHSEHNPLRKVVVDLFCGKEPNAKLKRADIMEAAKIALKKEITTHEYNKVVSELCESRGSLWVLKSGDGKPK
ncbi:hypothetical protein PVL29_004973 [Vitis rotundifolia]|uniref:DNA-directed RNA polymerase III subunit RPC5 n=1 Tax=Vitis rotundifolia TaxID=103349 RepID=A0AA39ABQ1_VITRO|nr:hypothetical protein PVL29_004973 [Vitis rotundifolia]